MELYLESLLNVDVDIMPPSEVEKIFRAFAEERKRALPQFTPDGIPITLENKFDDAIYNYLYEYWKTNSGEYDHKDDEIIMTKESSFTKNEKKFEQWLLQQYGMTKKEQREYTLKGNLDSLCEIFSAADMVLLARGLPSIGKELAQLGKKAVDDVAEEAVEKTVKTEVSEEVVENTAKKEMADTTEDLSQKTVDKDNALEDSSAVKGKSKPKPEELAQKVPDKYKQIYKCKEYANSLENSMKASGVHGERIHIKSNTPYIYSDKYGGNISTNGQHDAIKIGDKIYDNMTPNGINYDDWLTDLGIKDIPWEFTITTNPIN